jgi:hypothetical protein
VLEGVRMTPEARSRLRSRAAGGGA